MATNRARINEKDKNLWCNFIHLGKDSLSQLTEQSRLLSSKVFLPKMQTVELRLHLILTDLKIKKKEKKKNY